MYCCLQVYCKNRQELKIQRINFEKIYVPECASYEPLEENNEFFLTKEKQLQHRKQNWFKP